MTGIINPYTNAEYPPIEEPTLPPDPAQAPPRRGRDLRPSPGRLLVMRQKVETTINGIQKAPETIEREEAFNIFATVVAVGEQTPGGSAPWFKKGDVVTIEPSMARQIELAEGVAVELIPFAAVTGVFADEPEGDPED